MTDERLPKVLIPMIRKDFPELTQGEIITASEEDLKKAKEFLDSFPKINRVSDKLIMDSI